MDADPQLADLLKTENLPNLLRAKIHLCIALQEVSQDLAGTPPPGLARLLLALPPLLDGLMEMQSDLKMLREQAGLAAAPVTPSPN